MPRTVLSDLTTWITEAALRHPLDLAAHVAERRGIDRTAARAVLHKLAAHHWLCQVGTPRRPRHVPGLLRQVVRRSPRQGLQDKGKLSSQPDRHTGRGLFYTAKLADVFDLHANNSAFQQREWLREQGQRCRPASPRGTAVHVAICLDTERTLDAVLRRYSLDGAGYGFERTVVPLQLITAAQQGLSSRAQAQRVAARLGKFRRAELDFAGLADVGPAFADELFHVFGASHPGLRLVPMNMAPRVAEMVAASSRP